MPKHKAKLHFNKNLESKHNLLIKFDQLSYYERKKFIKKFHKNCDLEISSRPLVYEKLVYKELRTTSPPDSLENENFQASYLY